MLMYGNGLPAVCSETPLSAASHLVGNGCLQDREGRLKWSCRNRLSASLLTCCFFQEAQRKLASLFLGAINLQLWAGSLHRPGWWERVRGWVLLCWEVRCSAFSSKPAVPALALTAFPGEHCYLWYLFRVVFSSHSSPWCSPAVPWNQFWLFPSTSYPSLPLQLPSRV